MTPHTGGYPNAIKGGDQDMSRRTIWVTGAGVAAVIAVLGLAVHVRRKRAPAVPDA